VGIGILLLVVTGKLPALAAIAAPIAAFGRRLCARAVFFYRPQCVKYIFRAGGQPQALEPPTPTQINTRAERAPMTVKRAEYILVLSRRQRRLQNFARTHRKLMGKMHPDKDGTDFLAASHQRGAGFSDSPPRRHVISACRSPNPAASCAS
jgi:hypothetical protein